MRVYVPYWEWEDWKAGMWRKVSDEEYSKLLVDAIEFTGDWIRYGSAMREVIFAWDRTMLNSLTNPSMNRRAFVGHCAVQYEIGIPEYITRAAWGRLTDRQRKEANLQADKAIKLWHETRNRELRQNMGESVLF